MKNLALLAGAIFLIVACKKTETQYIDQDNKKETVNDQKSDTIKTLSERSDTLQMRNEEADVKTDND